MDLPRTIILFILFRLSYCEPRYIGNDVVLREYAYTTVGLPYATFMMDSELPEGALHRVSLYSHSDLPDVQRSLEPQRDKRCIWLQLFERASRPLPQFLHTLKFQRKVCLNDLYDTKYSVDIKSRPTIRKRFFFGWTCADMYCPISYGRVPGNDDMLHNKYYYAEPSIQSYIPLLKKVDYEWSIGITIDAFPTDNITEVTSLPTGTAGAGNSKTTIPGQATTGTSEGTDVPTTEAGESEEDDEVVVVMSSDPPVLTYTVAAALCVGVSASSVYLVYRVYTHVATQSAKLAPSVSYPDNPSPVQDMYRVDKAYEHYPQKIDPGRDGLSDVLLDAEEPVATEAMNGKEDSLFSTTPERVQP